jgi:hypothetical protein
MDDKLKSLLENALGKRFQEGAGWCSTDFLKQEFSRVQLDSGLVRLSQTKRRLGAAEWSSPYSVEDYETARELIENARDTHPRFRKLPAEGTEEKPRDILAEGAGTPETFHAELQWERREQHKEDKYKDSGLGA